MASYVQTDKRLYSSFLPNEPSGDARDLVQERWAAPARSVWTTVVRFPALLMRVLYLVSHCGLCQCHSMSPAESPSSAHSPLLARGSALAAPAVALGDEGKEMVLEWEVEREWGEAHWGSQRRRPGRETSEVGCRIQEVGCRTQEVGGGAAGGARCGNGECSEYNQSFLKVSVIPEPDVNSQHVQVFSL